MARFTLPRDLYHGPNALEALKTLPGKRAMICVGGGSMKRFGFLDRVEAYLKEAGMEVELFEGIEPDPSVETVMRGAEAMLKFEPDWIIAMGGGSPIDAAKAMWIKYEYPEITFEEMCKVFGIPPLRRKAHFCAISSTSGTATEVTAFSIITDYQKGIKYPIADFEITPRTSSSHTSQAWTPWHAPWRTLPPSSPRASCQQCSRSATPASTKAWDASSSRANSHSNSSSATPRRTANRARPAASRRSMKPSWLSTPSKRKLFYAE